MTSIQTKTIHICYYGLWTFLLLSHCRGLLLPSWRSLPLHFGRLVQKFSSQSQLCHACHELMASFVSFSPGQTSGWTLVRSEENTITVRQKHRDNTAGNLRTSSTSGCRLCELLYHTLQAEGHLQDDQIYSLFFWGASPAKKELQLARGTSDQFTKHVSQWTRPATLVMYWRHSPSVMDTSRLQRLLELPILPEQNPTSIKATGFVENMSNQCEMEHTGCARPSGPLPMRVLDLCSKSCPSKIRLYLSKKEPVRYATLSYSWGGTDKLLLTERATIKARCKEIEIEDFPQTLRDGITIARALGFRYLWIDSVCIIQDDDNDWAYQGAAMTEIYGNSNLNISASSSMSSDKGFLTYLPDFGIKIRNLPISNEITTNNVYVGPELPTFNLEALAVSRRGWIFQERLVTAATVHYTDHGIVWECVKHTQLQHVQPISTAPWKAQWRSLLQSIPGTSTQRSADWKDFRSWHEWVSAYSDRNLFEWTDKLPAIAGVARTFASMFSLNYCAGLWAENLKQDLLWSRHHEVITLTRSAKYVAPSWSWASVNGLLDYRKITLAIPEEKLDLKIISYFVREEFPASFGKVTHGHLIVQGLLQAVVIDKNSHLSIMKKPHQACGVAEGFKNNFNVLCMLDDFEQTEDPYLSLWCLRVGSFEVSGRRGHVYLLLRWVSGYNTFRRAGLAETDPWIDGLNKIEDSGVFISATWTQLKLI